MEIPLSADTPAPVGRATTGVFLSTFLSLLLKLCMDDKVAKRLDQVKDPRLGSGLLAGNREMKTGKKIILFASLVLLTAILGLAGAVAYCALHPQSVKSLVETTLSRTTGASITIEVLSYSFRPMEIAAEGVTAAPGPGGSGFHLKIPRIRAACSLEGPFGQKTLTVHRIEITGMSCDIYQDAALPDMAPDPRTPSLFGPVLKRVFAFLVFRGIRVERAIMSDARVKARLKEQTLDLEEIQGRMDADRTIHISLCGRFEWPSRQILLKAPLVRMNTDGAVSLDHIKISSSAVFERIRFKSPAVDFHDLKGEARLTYRPEQGEVSFDGMTLDLEKARIQEAGEKKPVCLDLHMAAEGAFNLKNRRLKVRTLDLALGDRFQMAGDLFAALGWPGQVDLTVKTCRIIPREMVGLLPPRFRKQADPFGLDGPILVAGRAGAVETKSGWTWEGNIEAAFNRNVFSFRTASARVTGALTGKLALAGKVPRLEIRTDLNAEDATFQGNGMETGPCKAIFSLSGRYPVLDVNRLSLQTPWIAWQGRDRPLRAGDVRIKTEKGQIDLRTLSCRFPEIRFDSSLLKNIAVSLDLRDGKTWTVEIQGKETGMTGLARGLGFLPSDWQAAGHDALKARIKFERGNKAAADSEWIFQNLGFQDPTGSLMGEKVCIKASLRGTFDLLHDLSTVEMALDADKGEVLYDRFYVDLQQSPLFFRFTGTYSAPDKAVDISSLSLGLKQIATCRVNGRWFEKKPGWGWDLIMEIPEIPLSPAFNLFVVEPFQMEKPSLRLLEIAGTISAHANLTGDLSNWRARGSISWKDGRIAYGDRKFSLNGIDLSFPLWIQDPDRDDALEDLSGSLSIGSLRLPFMPEQSLFFPLRAHGGNGLQIPSPTYIQIPGGRIRLEPVHIEGLMGPMLSIRSGLVMHRVDLGPILSPFWPRPVKGVLFGNLIPVQLRGGRLRAGGQASAAVFDGEINFSNLGVDRLFTGTPVVKLDARWKDLDLSRITSDTPFGKIEGRLNGYAKGLEIAGGQVQQFDLLLETARKEGTPQRVSVKAVDNIARIGGGRSPFMGIAGILAGIFKEFPYEKIGVHAILENDRFRINGTIREGDTEYLVKRGLLSGLNVVNQNPDNQVSFKDMVNRIKRIKTSKGSPVIK